MKKINTNPLEGMKIENIATELNDITLGKYVIFVDLYNGSINIGKNSRKKHNELVIGEVEFLDKSKKKSLISSILIFVTLFKNIIILARLSLELKQTIISAKNMLRNSDQCLMGKILITLVQHQCVYMMSMY